jgi:hypothetical protein
LTASWVAGAPAFSEIQVLQKIPNPAIPICVSSLNPNGYYPVHKGYLTRTTSDLEKLGIDLVLKIIPYLI